MAIGLAVIGALLGEAADAAEQRRIGEVSGEFTAVRGRINEEVSRHQ